MKLFSKRHNLYNDEAAKRRMVRELVGGTILFVVALVCTVVFLQNMGG